MVKRTLRYLNGTLDHGLTLKSCKNLTITRFVDVDWTSDPDDIKSTTWYCIYLGEIPVSWCS